MDMKVNFSFDKPKIKVNKEQIDGWNLGGPSGLGYLSLRGTNEKKFNKTYDEYLAYIWQSNQPNYFKYVLNTVVQDHNLSQPNYADTYQPRTKKEAARDLVDKIPLLSGLGNQVDKWTPKTGGAISISKGLFDEERDKYLLLTSKAVTLPLETRLWSNKKKDYARDLIYHEMLYRANATSGTEGEEADIKLYLERVDEEWSGKKRDRGQTVVGGAVRPIYDANKYGGSNPKWKDVDRMLYSPPIKPTYGWPGIFKGKLDGTLRGRVKITDVGSIPSGKFYDVFEAKQRQSERFAPGWMGQAGWESEQLQCACYETLWEADSKRSQWVYANRLNGGRLSCGAWLLETNSNGEQQMNFVKATDDTKKTVNKLWSLFLDDLNLTQNWKLQTDESKQHQQRLIKSVASLI